MRLYVVGMEGQIARSLGEAAALNPDIVFGCSRRAERRLATPCSENRRERRCEAWRPDTTSIDGPRLRQQKKQSPYIETDTVGPETVYGRSKLEGEHAVAAANQRHIIPRTAWVYSPFGNNIARTMHRRLHLTTLPKRSTAPMVACQSWSRIAQTTMGPINFPKSIFR